MKTETVLLEKVRMAALQALPAAMVNDFTVESTADWLHTTLAVRVEREVYSHRLAEWDLELAVPANWWQHLKMQLGLKHRLVTKHASIVRRRTFPDIPVSAHHLLITSLVQEDRA